MMSSLGGILSCEMKQSDNFGFICFKPSIISGEIIIPNKVDNGKFNISQHFLESLQNDLIYEGKGDIDQLLKGTCEYQHARIKGEINSFLLLDGHPLWEHLYQTDIKVKSLRNKFLNL